MEKDKEQKTSGGFALKELGLLFLLFAKIGGFTFGGGYAMLPILQREIVERRNWATNEELMDYYAIGQCTPGIIAVNTSTFIGYKRRGIIGGIVATLGCVTPSVIIIMLIAALINHFADIVWVQHALAGIRVCVCVLVFDTVFKLAKKSLKDAVTWIIFAAVIVLTLFTDLPAVLWVVSAAAVGIVVKVIKEARKQKKAAAEPAESETAAAPAEANAEAASAESNADAAPAESNAVNAAAESNSDTVPAEGDAGSGNAGKEEKK